MRHWWEGHAGPETMITQCDRGVHGVGAFRSAGAQPAPGRRPVPTDRRPAVPSPGLATAAL